MKIQVNNLEWAVEYKNADSTELLIDNEPCLGYCSLLTQGIYIRKGMSRQLTRETVLHELAHCFMFSYGICNERKTEEDLCNFVGAFADKLVYMTDKFMETFSE